MSVKHKLLTLNSVSRDGELKSNSTLLFHSLFSLSPPPPSIGLLAWPTKLCCLGRSKFSHRISLLTHIGVWFYLLAAVVVAPTWKLILAFNNPGFFVDASFEAFLKLCSFPLPTQRPWLLSLKQAVGLLNCIFKFLRTVVLPKFKSNGSPSICDFFPHPAKQGTISSLLLLMNSTHFKSHIFRHYLHNGVMALLTWYEERRIAHTENLCLCQHWKVIASLKGS